MRLHGSEYPESMRPYEFQTLDCCQLWSLVGLNLLPETDSFAFLYSVSWTTLRSSEQEVRAVWTVVYIQ